VKPRPTESLLADLARIWARYHPEDIQAALAFLRDPGAVEQFALLVEQTGSAAARTKNTRGRRGTTGSPREGRKAGIEQRLAAIQRARPDDAALLARVLAIADSRWTKPKSQALAAALATHRLPPVNGRTAKDRRRQLLAVVEAAPRRALEAIERAFEETSEHGGSLSEWSEIILPGRGDRG
jgi:hypothetical protein